ncbi:hypothetical protein [Candidatus Pelagibacter communis]|uniref:hypothetical protein n=1 Tax=Candidatus Pelagibacter TaxID=198251 RepID=UPI003EE3A301
MFSKFFKILAFLTLFIFTTGFIPILSLIGPGMTILSSGNIYKAGAQYMIDQTMKKKTGKSTLEYFTNDIQNKNNEIDINEELRKLVERRILETRAKLDLTKFNQ